MTIDIGGLTYDVYITRKNNKNMYLRVKSDGIYITCHYLVPKSMIVSFIRRNEESIAREFNRQQKKEQKKLNICRK